MNFSARQTSVSSSEIERLTHRGTGGLAPLAGAFGLIVLSGHPVSTNVSGAVNVLIMAIADDHGVELPVMRQFLPPLRNEAVSLLVQNYDNWLFQGPPEHEHKFFAKLAGERSKVRAELGSMVGVHPDNAKALLRFYSPIDVELLSNDELERGQSGRPPLFNIYASALAERIESVCQRPLFISDL